MEAYESLEWRIVRGCLWGLATILLLNAMILIAAGYTPIPTATMSINGEVSDIRGPVPGLIVGAIGIGVLAFSMLITRLMPSAALQLDTGALVVRRGARAVATYGAADVIELIIGDRPATYGIMAYDLVPLIVGVKHAKRARYFVVARGSLTEMERLRDRYGGKSTIKK